LVVVTVTASQVKEQMSVGTQLMEEVTQSVVTICYTLLLDSGFDLWAEFDLVEIV